MSEAIQATINTISETTGVLLVTARHPNICLHADTGSARLGLGHHMHRVLAEAALDVFARAKDNTMRVVVGDHTIQLARSAEGGQWSMAIMFPTGDAVSKSVARMLRRGLRRLGRAME